MIRTDDLLRIASRLTDQLGDVNPNEWRRWARTTLAGRDLEKGIKRARALSGDRMLRPAPRRSLESIANGVQKGAPDLQRLQHDELSAVFGYVSRLLAIRALFGPQ